MTSRSDVPNSKQRDRADYGFARARDLAFDSVRSLWRRRSAEGMKQIDIADALDRSPAWVSRAFRGPANWTLRTFGELVEALDGEIEIKVYASEDAVETPSNFHAYVEYEPGEFACRTLKASLAPSTSTASQDSPPDIDDLLNTANPQPALAA